MNKLSSALLCATACAAALMSGGCSKAPEPVAAVVPSAASAASAVGANVSDIDVTEHVKTALRQNEALKNFDISVVTINGDVRLTGMLDNRSQIDEAIRVARVAEGTHAIHDELTVKP